MSETTECRHCGRERDGHAYLLLYGHWDPERDGFARPPEAEPYCRDCWQERYGREVGAHYEIHSAQRLWDILRAADGDLVADCMPIFVGGRPFIRIVDDKLQAVAPKPRRGGRTEDGTPIIQFETVNVDVDREWFFETFRIDQDLPDDEYPTTAILKPVEETPFADVRERGGDSYKLTHFNYDH